MWEHHLLHIKGDNAIVSLAFCYQVSWDEMKKWSQIRHTSKFSYLLLTTYYVAADGEAIKSL